jgi:biopolymer transport protein ExbD
MSVPDKTGFTQREARTLVRKAVARVPEGESIRHLNIMPMMDMMTILLVAFIFQISTSTLDVIAGKVAMPTADVDAPLPDKSWTLVITTTGVVVEGQTIVPVLNGDVDPGEKEGGSLGRKIPRLTSYLANLRGQEMRSLQLEGGDPTKAKEPELLVIADRMTPYNLLVEVMFSAKQKEAGFKHFRLILQKNFPPHVAKQ